MSPMVCLHVLVLLWATTGLIAHDSQLDAAALTFWRASLAFLSAGAFVCWRGQSLRFSWRQYAEFLGVGVLIGVHWVCFFAAVKLANVSICAAAMGATSFFTSLAEPILLRKKFEWREIGIGLLVLCGLVLVAGVDGKYQIGLMVGLVASLLAAIFPVMNRGLMLKYDGVRPLQVVTWEFLGATLVVLVALPWISHGSSGDLAEVYRGLFAWQICDVWRIGFLSLVCTTLAYYWHTRLLKTLSAYTVNLTVNFEPMYAVLLAALFYREYESLNVSFYLGMLTICAANVLHTMMRPKAPKRFT